MPISPPDWYFSRFFSFSLLSFDLFCTRTVNGFVILRAIICWISVVFSQRKITIFAFFNSIGLNKFESIIKAEQKKEPPKMVSSKTKTERKKWGSLPHTYTYSSSQTSDDDDGSKKTYSQEANMRKNKKFKHDITHNCFVDFQAENFFPFHFPCFFLDFPFCFSFSFFGWIFHYALLFSFSLLFCFLVDMLYIGFMWKTRFFAVVERRQKPFFRSFCSCSGQTSTHCALTRRKRHIFDFGWLAKMLEKLRWIIYSERENYKKAGGIPNIADKAEHCVTYAKDKSEEHEKKS